MDIFKGDLLKPVSFTSLLNRPTSSPNYIIDRASCKSPKLPFDKLRVNGGRVKIIDFSPFVLNLSKHKR